MSAVVAVLAALFGRERSGQGATLDLSMHEAALYWVMLPGARDLIDGGAEAVSELPTFGDHACYNVYETRDGRQVALGALETILVFEGLELRLEGTDADAVPEPAVGHVGGLSERAVPALAQVFDGAISVGLLLEAGDLKLKAAVHPFGSQLGVRLGGSGARSQVGQAVPRVRDHRR